MARWQGGKVKWQNGNVGFVRHYFFLFTRTDGRSMRETPTLRKMTMLCFAAKWQNDKCPVLFFVVGKK